MFTLGSWIELNGVITNSFGAEVHFFTNETRVKLWTLYQWYFFTFSEAKVQVLGGPDVYVDTGSVINLTCSIWWTPSPPEVTLWHHNSSLISHRGPRPGVSLIIDKADVTTVQLLIMSARSVNYFPIGKTWHCHWLVTLTKTKLNLV